MLGDDGVVSKLIAPSKEEPKSHTDLQAEVADFFEPGGGLEQAWRATDFPYEHRVQQQEMAQAVVAALQEGEHLLVEAGTGVGKSFAYLVPMILKAIRDGVKVIVSTHTINLQEQLIMKDLPFLQKHLGVVFKAVLVKGRSNYLCLRRLARARQMEDELFRSEQVAELDDLAAWSATTEEGSVQDMQREPSHEVWDVVCAEQGNCLWQKCPEYSTCFFMKARREMLDAHVLVVNHHLFFSDLAIRASGAALLPDYAHLVIDEAHTVEHVASEHLGIRLSQYGFEHWLRRLYVPDQDKGILAVLRHGKTAHEVSNLWEQVRKFFAELIRWAELKDTTTQKIVDHPIRMETAMPNHFRKVCFMVAQLVETLEEGGLRSELEAIHRRGLQMHQALDAFMNHGCDDHVYWLDLTGKRKKNVVLHSAPIEVREPLRKMVFEEVRSAVLTSATLSCGDDMTYLQRRMGAEEAGTLRLGSPFDFARQMRVKIAAYMPSPTDTSRFAEACAEECVKFACSTGGRAFVLFTSRKLMLEVAELAESGLRAVGLGLLVQGGGLAKQLMLEKFVEEGHAVLFGLDSFWTGIDVRGDALTNVMITRLPFAVPDQPLTKARVDRIQAAGGNAFREYSLPEAILKFRQGVGRLIRTATDEGVIIVFDNRILTKPYGRLFLQAIPECPVEVLEHNNSG